MIFLMMAEMLILWSCGATEFNFFILMYGCYSKLFEISVTKTQFYVREMAFSKLYVVRCLIVQGHLKTRM